MVQNTVEALAQPKGIRWGLAVAVLAVAVLTGAVALALWALAPGSRVLSRRESPRLKADGPTGLTRVLGRVVPGTSRFEPSNETCTHRFAVESPKAGRFEVEVPFCGFPTEFHDASSLDVLVEGAQAGDRLLATRVEPQIGGCCGGPHCYR